MFKKACLLAIIVLFAAACYKDTLREIPAEVKLNDGTVLDCPGGITVLYYDLYCYRNKTDHTNIRIDKTSVAGYSTKPVTPATPRQKIFLINVLFRFC